MYTITDLKKSFKQPGGEIQTVLNINSLTLPSSGCIVLHGSSGAGKTTFLNILSGIDTPDEGEVMWNTTKITQLSEVARDDWRNKNIGLIFQDFQLFTHMSILDNVLLPYTFAPHKHSIKELRQQAMEHLNRMGVPKNRKNIGDLSRGEQQRVAITRALLKNPPIILADEPTASLDEKNAEIIINLLFEETKRKNALLFLVSHDEKVKMRSDYSFQLIKGCIK